MVRTLQKAHTKAMEHGWNILKFYAPSYNPLETDEYGRPKGAMARLGAKNLKDYQGFRRGLSGTYDDGSRSYRRKRAKEMEEAEEDTGYGGKKYQTDEPSSGDAESFRGDWVGGTQGYAENKLGRRMKHSGSDTDYREMQEVRYHEGMQAPEGQDPKMKR